MEIRYIYINDILLHIDKMISESLHIFAYMYMSSEQM